MRFGVLGPLQVLAGESGQPDAVSAPRLRSLLAALLWRAGQPVPSDELAELVWDGAPPGHAPDATRSLVMRLRRRLDQRAAARIVTRALDILHDIGEFWLTAFPLDHLGDADEIHRKLHDLGALARTWCTGGRTITRVT